MKKSKLAKVLTVSLAALMVFGLASCGGGSGKVSDKDITVISREEGSGTRDAFTELTGVLQDDVDKTVDTAEISNSTSVVTQSVAGNDAAIGYISLGSLDDTVKAVKVDGVEATVDNIKSGDYKIQRPFNIVTKGEVKELPAAKMGIMAGIILGIGRAIGETMAVVMVCGNQAIMPDGLTNGVRTLTANIVLEMGYASGLHREALISTAVVLFVFILIINLSFMALKRRADR